MSQDSQMEYALRLMEYEGKLIFQEMFKLANLCEEIESDGNDKELSTDLYKDFLRVARNFYKNHGAFRAEVERTTLAKKALSSSPGT